ncbi:MAG: response regulator [Candidatus Kapabacteria bacterium]|nr:response regulator [Candidatus Kapabacteria bacterium]
MGFGIFALQVRRRRGAAPVLRAVLVDDEPIAVETLRLLVEQYCSDIVGVEGVAFSAREARQLVARVQPDIVFLDVEMPGESGFDFLRSMPQRRFAVIFVTAYDHYAIQALRMSAVDYLLKPVNAKELREAVERVWEQRHSQMERIGALFSNLGHLSPKRLVLPLLRGYRIVGVDEVLYCRSERSYTHVVTTTERLLTTRLLGEWEEMLAARGFVRVHRAFLVNVQHIRAIRGSEPEGGGVAVLTTGEELPIARRRFAQVLRLLQQV